MPHAPEYVVEIARCFHARTGLDITPTLVASILTSAEENLRLKAEREPNPPPGAAKGPIIEAGSKLDAGFAALVEELSKPIGDPVLAEAAFGAMNEFVRGTSDHSSRGETIRVFCESVGRILDGQSDAPGIAGTPWGDTRRRLLSLVRECREQRAELESIRVIVKPPADQPLHYAVFDLKQRLEKLENESREIRRNRIAAHRYIAAFAELEKSIESSRYHFEAALKHAAAATNDMPSA